MAWALNFLTMSSRVPQHVQQDYSKLNFQQRQAHEPRISTTLCDGRICAGDSHVFNWPILLRLMLICGYR